jgi:dephospho-CoA kinase
VAHPLQIGITGGIGTGKSVVCSVFKCLNVPVYDADSRAKYVMTTDGILISDIKKEFGDLSFDKEGRLNRKYLGEKVFSDKTKLDRLNALVHPRVALDYEQWVRKNSSAKYVLKEAALLFESGSYKLLHKIIVVDSPIELRMTRVLSRDAHRTAQQVEEIMKNQLDEEVKLKRADYIIKNDEKNFLITQVLALHRLFIQQQA